MTAIAQDVQNLDAFKLRPTANGVIYAGDGHTVLAILRSRDENRKLVTSDQIAKVMKQAIVAIEDKRFYEHGGDRPDRPRARGGRRPDRRARTQGGSTITQQFVKNVYTERPAHPPAQARRGGAGHQVESAGRRSRSSPST